MHAAVVQQDVTKPNRDLTLLCPQFLTKIELALKACYENDPMYPAYIFEGFRSPERQDWLYAAGRTRDTDGDGRIVTRAKAWLSWHQYGLGVDIAFKRQNQWSWEGSFLEVAKILKAHGLEWGGVGDMGHFQISGGIDIKAACQIARNSGLPTLWQAVFKKADVRYK